MKKTKEQDEIRSLVDDVTTMDIKTYLDAFVERHLQFRSGTGDPILSLRYFALKYFQELAEPSIRDVAVNHSSLVSFAKAIYTTASAAKLVREAELFALRYLYKKGLDDLMEFFEDIGVGTFKAKKEDVEQEIKAKETGEPYSPICLKDFIMSNDLFIALSGEADIMSVEGAEIVSSKTDKSTQLDMNFPLPGHGIGFGEGISEDIYD